MGLYGNMLTHFTGQFRDFTYFNMVPGINSGYTIDQNVPVVTLRGVLQNSESRVMDGNGNLVRSNDEYVWTTTELEVGRFVKFGDTTFRIIPSNEWIFEGGFFRYMVNRLVGDNGTPSTGDFTTGLGGTPL